MTQSTSEFVATDEIVTRQTLQDIVDLEINPEDLKIQVCSGEWRRIIGSETLWQFYKDPDWEA